MRPTRADPAAPRPASCVVGRAQRHPGLLLRRRPLRRRSTTPSRTGCAMHGDGADLIDVGGESTRPGAQRVDAEEEQARVAAGDPRAGRGTGSRSAIDTYRAAVAAAGAGRRRGGRQRRLRRPGRSGHGARSSATPAARGSSCTGAGTATRMQHLAHYDDVVADVRAELLQRVDAAVAAGVDRRPARARPRPRLRQDRRAQLGPAGRTSTPCVDSGCRCSSAASRKSFLGQAARRRRTARRARSTTARTPPPRSPRYCAPARRVGGAGARRPPVGRRRARRRRDPRRSLE